MILQFTGTWHWTLMIPLAAVLIALTVWIYRQHNLPAPWNKYLPALRIIALLCLLLSLLRPILARVDSRAVRGIIPVVIDDSGSMSVADQYEEHEAVKITWNMEWFPQRMRVTVFETPPDALIEAGTALTNAIGITRMLTPLETEDRPLRRQLGRLQREISSVNNRLGRLQIETVRAVSNAEYLGNDTETEKPDSFQPLYAAWLQSAEALGDKLMSFADTITAIRDDIGEDDPQNPLIPEELVDKQENLLNAWAALAADYSALQLPADRALAQAGITEVDEALEKLSETTRWQLALHVLLNSPHNLAGRLQRKGEVEIFSLDEEQIEPLSEDDLAELEPRRVNTRLGSLMHRLLQNYEVEPLAGLIVITDGRVNAGLPLSVVREMATERNLPLIALGIGSEKPPDDIAIESVTVPETAFKGDLIKASIVLHRNGFEDRELPMTIRRGSRIMHEFTVPPGSSSRVTIDTSFEEDEDGDHRYVIETPVLDGEALDNNNSRTFYARLLDDRIKTLLVDEFPRWESRYLRMMLSRDRRVELDTVFIASREEGKLPREPGGWPQDREALFGYQTVILGDVNPDHFSESELRDLHDFVIERGGTMILLSGPHHMPGRYVATPLAEAFPFQWNSSELTATTDEDAEEAFKNKRLRITQQGRHDTLPRIGTDHETNEKLWQRLPGMNWVTPDVRVVPAADTLVETAEHELPVIIRGYSGAGRVLFLGSDSFWRWRDRTRWHYHHRFWSQIMLWSAIGRTSGSDQYVKMMTDRPRYGTDEPVMISVRLLDEEQRPVENAQAVVDVYDEDEERIREVPLFPAETGAGEYRGEITALPHGHFTLKPRIFEMRHLDITAELGIDIGDVVTGEYVHLEQDRPRLGRWADAYQPVYDPLDAMDAIEPVEITDKRRREYEQPVHAILLLIAAIALGAEWHLRKRCRLP